MGKPPVKVYDKFCDKYFDLCRKAGKEQYLVPYLMSSHPGSTLNEAVDLALYLKKKNVRPEQVQDFYPTPGTAATTMYYTGIDPFTGKNVYVPRDYNEKKMQRALLQSSRPENREIVEKAIRLSGRRDAMCLLPHSFSQGSAGRTHFASPKKAVSNRTEKKKGGVKKGKGSDTAKKRRAEKNK